MNEIEAINFFRYLDNGVPKSNLLFGKSKDYENKMQLLAIQALQEKAEMEKGCEYCKEGKPILNEMGELQIDDSDATLWLICQSSPDDIYEEHTSIKFCPMCGRKLSDHISEANGMEEEEK